MLPLLHFDQIAFRRARICNRSQLVCHMLKRMEPFPGGVRNGEVTFSTRKTYQRILQTNFQSWLLEILLICYNFVHDARIFHTAKKILGNQFASKLLIILSQIINIHNSRRLSDRNASNWLRNSLTYSISCIKHTGPPRPRC